MGGEAMTSRYSHGGAGWNQELRRAVTALESAYPTPLSYGLSYERWRMMVRESLDAPKYAKELGGGVVVPTGFEPVSEP